MNSAHNMMPLGERQDADAFAEDTIDLLAYWRTVMRNKWPIAGLAAVIVVITVVVVSTMTPIYSATARLQIESEQAQVVSIEEIYGIDSSQREYYQTQFEILKSRELAERVIRELGIEKHIEYLSKDDDDVNLRDYIPFLPAATPKVPDAIWQGIVEIFRENLSITPARNTQLVDITFESTDPDLAQKVADAMGDAYIDNYLESKLELTRKAASWLTERLGKLKEELDISERKLRDYQEKENLIDVAGIQTLTAKELDESTRRLVEVRNRAAAAKSQLDAAGNVRAGYQAAWESLPVVLRDKLSQDLKSQEAKADNEFSELKRRYGPKHPRYIGSQSKVDSASQSFRNRVMQMVTGLNDIYRQASVDQIEIERSLTKSKQEIQDLNRKGYELSQLEREAQTNRDLYDLFFQRFRETNETDFSTANARFVDHAARPYVPVKPKKLLIVALAGVLSLMLGVMLAFLREALDNTVRSAGELEEKLHQGILGVLPLEKVDTKKAGEAVSHLYRSKGHNNFAEAVRSLRTSVVLAGLDKPQKIIIVTSSVPGEGKTTVSSNLALALGQMEKVLLIDADMRRPSIAAEYGMEKGTAGLSELVARTSEAKDSIHSFKDLGIDVLPAGAVPPNPLDLLSSQRFAKILEKLAESYDRIIIDSAPTQAVSDSLVLSQNADALVFVVRSDSTPTQVAKNALDRLHKVNAPIIGVVLNQFDAAVAAKYGGYGSGSYGYYGYGYSSKSYS